MASDGNHSTGGALQGDLEEPSSASSAAQQQAHMLSENNKVVARAAVGEGPEQGDDTMQHDDLADKGTERVFESSKGFSGSATSQVRHSSSARIILTTYPVCSSRKNSPSAIDIPLVGPIGYGSSAAELGAP